MGTVSQLRRSTLHRKPSGKKKKKRKKQNQERLYHRMMTIKRGFWCLCVSALLAGAVCQESRRNLMDMHEAVDAATDAMNATDDMMNGTMMNDTMMNGTMMNDTEEHDHDHDHEGDDHSDEDAADDDDGEASEDDSRRMLRKLAMA